MMMFCLGSSIARDSFVRVADAFADVTGLKGAARSITLKLLHIPSDREGYIQLRRSFDNIILPEPPATGKQKPGPPGKAKKPEPGRSMVHPT